MIGFLPCPINIHIKDMENQQEVQQNEEISDLIYEINAKGEREIIRSKESNKRAYLRFSNRTSRPVIVWWRDYRGGKRQYTTLEAFQYFDITTYITHPWQFTDAATNEHYVINNKTVYRAPENIGDMRHRTNWNITIPVRTLRATVLLSIATLIQNTDAADALELPQVLTKELKDLIELLGRLPSPED